MVCLESASRCAIEGKIASIRSPRYPGVVVPVSFGGECRYRRRRRRHLGCLARNRRRRRRHDRRAKRKYRWKRNFVAFDEVATTTKKAEEMRADWLMAKENGRSATASWGSGSVRMEEVDVITQGLSSNKDQR